MSEYTQEEQNEAFNKIANVKVLYLVQILKMINISCSRGAYLPNELTFIGSINDLISKAVEKAMITARTELKIKNGIVDIKKPLSETNNLKQKNGNQNELTEILEKFKEQQEQILKLQQQLQEEKLDKERIVDKQQTVDVEQEQDQQQKQQQIQQQQQQQQQIQQQGQRGKRSQKPMLPGPIPTKQNKGKMQLPPQLQPVQTKITVNNDQDLSKFVALNREYEGQEVENNTGPDLIYDPDELQM